MSDLADLTGPAVEAGGAPPADPDAPAETRWADVHLVLIDGSGFIFRAFHALPPMNRADGTPVNAVYGFTNMLARFLREHVGTHLAVIFDAGRLTFRNEMYDQYKAHRPEPPPELVPQFALVREATAAFGVPAIELAGLGGGRPDRRLCLHGGGGRRALHHRLVRQGPDAADPARRRHAGPDQAEADRPGRGARRSSASPPTR